MRAYSFYLDQTIDHRGRSFGEILKWTDSQLENVHDYIQWLFPLNEPSGANKRAPLLTTEEIRRFRADVVAQKRLTDAFERMLRFYGLRLTRTRNRIRVQKAANYDSRKQIWLRPHNHNFLRITRIIKSLRLLGLDKPARAFFECLRRLFAEDSALIGETTFRYWQSAAGDQE